jgi:2-amino-4-hydroxy-6-hydroxymethyldihydropteridine diphosphokinase
MRNSVYILLGGNLDDREENLRRARVYIEVELGKILRRSSIYETASWGIKEQPDFLNQVLLVETKFSAEEMMQKILGIENKMGRIRTEKNASRIIDIDILFFNDEVIHAIGLTVPHPEIENRKFVLVPLNEIAPDLLHPVLQLTIKDILSTSKDQLEVKRLEEL